MAFGLPTKEEIRDGLIARGVDPAMAEREAAVAARNNNRDAALSSLIYGTSGGRALMEAGPAIMSTGRAALSNIGTRAKDAIGTAREFMTKPSVAGEGFKINPQTGNVLQNVAPKGGVRPRPDLPFGVKLPAEPTFSVAQQLARYGLPSMGAVGATSYLANAGPDEKARQDAETGARQAEELRMQQEAAADQSAFRRAPNALPFFAGSDAARRSEMGGAPQTVTPGLLAMAGKDLGQGAAPSWNQPAAGDMPLMSRMSPESLRFSVDKARAAAPRQNQLDITARPVARPESIDKKDDGIMSKIFGGDPTAGMSREDLMNRYNESGSAADFLRADKALRAERPEMFQSEGMATGGSAKPHKDAALHKALEIIHALIGRH